MVIYQEEGEEEGLGEEQDSKKKGHDVFSHFFATAKRKSSF